MNGCDHHAPNSCRTCSGDSRDDWQRQKLADEAMKVREHRMRTDPAFRAAWVASFAPEMQDEMAADADRRYGLLVETSAA